MTLFTTYRNVFEEGANDGILSNMIQSTEYYSVFVICFCSRRGPHQANYVARLVITYSFTFVFLSSGPSGSCLGLQHVFTSYSTCKALIITSYHYSMISRT